MTCQRGSEIGVQPPADCALECRENVVGGPALKFPSSRFSPHVGWSASIEIHNHCSYHFWPPLRSMVDGTERHCRQPSNASKISPAMPFISLCTRSYEPGPYRHCCVGQDDTEERNGQHFAKLAGLV